MINMYIAFTVEKCVYTEYGRASLQYKHSNWEAEVEGWRIWYTHVCSPPPRLYLNQKETKMGPVTDRFCNNTVQMLMSKYSVIKRLMVRRRERTNFLRTVPAAGGLLGDPLWGTTIGKADSSDERGFQELGCKGEHIYHTGFVGLW